MNIKFKALLNVSIIAVATLGSMNNAIAKNSKSSDQSQFTVERHNIIDNLALKGSFVIRSSDIDNAANKNIGKTVKLGTFCSYTNHYAKQIPITVSSAYGAYQLVGTSRHISGKKVNYAIKVNNISMPYNRATMVTTKGGTNHTSCRGFAEEITLAISANDLKAAKAGTYMAKISLATSSS